MNILAKLAQFHTLRAQYEAHLKPGAKDGCWHWHGAKNSDGYPVLKVDGETELATRIGWKLSRGDLPPEGKVVIHSCDKPDCMNPKHWSLGTQQDNMQDMAEKGRGKPHGKDEYEVQKHASFLAELRKISFATSPYSAGTLEGPIGLFQESGQPPRKQPNLRVGAEKVGFTLSEYSAPIDSPRFKQESQLPPFRMPTLGTPVEKKAGAITPNGRLAHSRSIGLPKVTAPSGPSISEQSKPIGFGMKLQGGTKTT